MRRHCLLLLLPVLIAAPARAQRTDSCVVARITSRDQLAQVLARLPGTGVAASLARQGQPVVGWALAIAADSGAPPATRAAALQVLRYARWKAAMPELLRLAQPLRGSWIVWRGALAALSTYPYAELTPYWLDLIRFPRRVVREDALRGLSMTADERVMPMVREATSHEEDADMHALVAAVEARLRLPPALRDTLTFGWPPDSAGGRFIPSAAHQERPGCR